MSKTAPWLLLLGMTACGRDMVAPTSPQRTVTVSGWVRGPEGSPLPPGRVTVDPWWHVFGDWDKPCEGAPHIVPVDDTGRFSIPIEGIPRDQSVCIFLLSFDPGSAAPLPDQDRLTSRWMVKRPIPDQLNWGAVRLTSSSAVRPNAELSDDELEASIRAGWNASVAGWRSSDWNRLCREIAARPGARWESLAEQLLEQVRTQAPTGARSCPPGGALDLLTALRRHQGRGDPIELQIEHAARRVVVAPAMPSIVVRIVNRDVFPLVIEGGSWRFVARTPEGTRLPMDRFVPLGYAGPVSRVQIEPGESKLDEVSAANSLLPFQGTADATLVLCDGDHIENGLADLDGLMFVSTAHVQVEMRDHAEPRPSIDLWPVVAGDARIRALANEACVPLLEREGVLLVATDDCRRFIEVLAEHDALLLRIDAWWREEIGARREIKDDVEFADPASGSDPDDGARSILAARFWLQRGGRGGARYVFHLREHTGS